MPSPTAAELIAELRPIVHTHQAAFGVGASIGVGDLLSRADVDLDDEDQLRIVLATLRAMLVVIKVADDQMRGIDTDIVVAVAMGAFVEAVVEHAP